MKNILIRSGLTPFESQSVEEILNQNLIGANVGNLVYAYGIYRVLMTSDEVNFVPNRYETPMDQVQWTNENCESFIIPLADMFREDMVHRMEEMTAFIRELKIPCVITGVGVRAPLGKDIDEGYPFDDTVKAFLNAVLDKSAVIGVRGEITGRYLKHLGYSEGRHYMVIGCPSMYCFGSQLKRRELKLEPDSRISVNMSVVSTAPVTEFLYRILRERKNSCFLPQRRDELWLLYAGRPYEHKQPLPVYPAHITDPVYQEDRVKFFLNAGKWLDFLKTVDLSVGSRMHGNIAAVLAGTPAVLIPHDQRMMELVDYHKLPHVPAAEVRADWTLEQLLEKADFDSMYRCHEENFSRYLAFLEKNGIDHIFKNGGVVENAPLDRAMEQADLTNAEVDSVVHLSREEMAVRWQGICHNRAAFKNKQRDAWKKKYESVKRELEREREKNNESIMQKVKRKLNR